MSEPLETPTPAHNHWPSALGARSSTTLIGTTLPSKSESCNAARRVPNYTLYRIIRRAEILGTGPQIKSPANSHYCSAIYGSTLGPSAVVRTLRFLNSFTQSHINLRSRDRLIWRFGNCVHCTHVARSSSSHRPGHWSIKAWTMNPHDKPRTENREPRRSNWNQLEPLTKSKNRIWTGRRRVLLSWAMGNHGDIEARCYIICEENCDFPGTAQFTMVINLKTHTLSKSSNSCSRTKNHFLETERWINEAYI